MKWSKSPRATQCRKRNNAVNHCARSKNGSQRLGLGLLIVLIFSPSAQAHRDDYMNETFVYRTLERREVELEFWSDYFTEKDDEAGTVAYTPGIEWGITDRLMVDSAVTFRRLEGEGLLQRARTEARYRFGEEGSHLVDPAVSLEYEWEKEASGEILAALTPRLVLNRDFKQANVTLNLDGNFRIRGTPVFAPGYRLGLRYPEVGLVRYGVELQEVFSDSPEVLVVPQIWFAPWEEVTLRVGYAKRITSSGPRDYLRLGVEIGF